MLPIAPWLQAMTVEPVPPARSTNGRKSVGARRGIRRAVGRGFIAIGKMLAGSEPVATRPVSVGR